MPVPATQLETWSRRSQTDTAMRAHEDLRDAVRDARYSAVRDLDFSDYLQGSYRNYTNTVRDHDVDVVLQLNTCRTSDFSLLPHQDAAVLQGIELPAIYTLTHFRPGVVAALRMAFGGSSVQEGNKSIRVVGAPGAKLDADLVICQQHRL
jgi:hypothetical protein